MASIDYATAERAIVAAVSTAGESQRTANRWLQEAFLASSEAWLITVQLLAHANPSVAFFAGNALNTKVRSAWSSLTEEQRGAVFGAMGEFLSSVLAGALSPEKKVLERFAQAMASSSLATGGEALSTFFTNALLLAEKATSGAAASPAQQAACLSMALYLIHAMGTEAFARPNKHKAAAAAAAEATLGPLMAFFELACGGRNLPVQRGPSATAAGVGVDALNPQAPLPPAAFALLSPTPLAKEALLAAMTYTSAGVSLGAVQASCPGLLAAAIVALGSSPDPETVTSACDFLVQLVGEGGRDLEATVAAASLAPAGGAEEAAAAAAVAGSATLPPSIPRPETVRASAGGAGTADAATPTAHKAAARQALGGRQLSAAEATFTLLGYHSVLAGIAALGAKFRAQIISGGATGAPDGSTGAGADDSGGFVDDDAFIVSMTKLCTATVAAVPQLIAGPGAVAAAAARLSPEYAAVSEASAAALIDVLLECAQHPSLQIMETADEAWPHLSAVPPAGRSGAFGPSLFARVLERLLRGATLPEGFPESGDWEAYEHPAHLPLMDEAEFVTFREHVAVPALGGTFCELRGAFIDHIGALMSHAASGEGGWQATEVVLFATRAVNLEAKSLLRPAGRPAGAAAAAASAAAVAPAPGSAAADVATLTGFLTALFGAIGARASAFVACPPVITAAARCIHSYARWLSQRPALVEGCVRYLLDALTLPGASQYAASALRLLVPWSAARLANAEFVGTAVAAFAAARGSRALKDEDAAQAAAAIVRAVAALKPPEAAAGALEQLVGACSAHIKAAIADPDRIRSLHATLGAAVPGALPPAGSAARGRAGTGDSGGASRGAGRESLLDQLLSDRGQAPGEAPARESTQAARAAQKAIDRAADGAGADLQILASLAGVLDAGAVPTLLGLLWPDFSALVGLFPASDVVVEGVTACISACISAGREGGPGLLRDLLGFVLSVHAGRPSGACLECISTAVETHGGEVSSSGSGGTATPGSGAVVGVSPTSSRGTPTEPTELPALLSTALSQCLAPVFALLSGAGDAARVVLQEHSGLFAAAFNLGAAFVLSCPTLFFTSPEALLLVQAAHAALDNNSLDIELCRSTLGFLARFFYVASPALTLSPANTAALLSTLHIHPDTYPVLKSHVDAVAGSVVPSLVPLLFGLGTSGVAPELTDSLAEALLAMLVAYPSLSRGPLAAAAARMGEKLSPDVAAVLTPPVTAAIVDKLFAVGSASLGSPGSDATQPFRDLVADIVSICRGHTPLTELQREYGGVSRASAGGAGGFMSAASAGGFVSASSFR